MAVDFGKTVADYVRYNPGFPDELFDRLSMLGVGVRGQRILDLGTGTGALARGFAKRGCEVTGVDTSSELIEEAKRLSHEQDVRVEYAIANAERTMLQQVGFDVVAAGQSWQWFDRPKVVREVKRLLKPGGMLMIAQLDWLPLPGNAVEATEQLIEKYNPEWTLGGGSGLHPDWLLDLRSQGFVDVQTFSFDLTLGFSHDSWRGRVRASAGVRASLSPDMVARFDENLRAILVERFSEEPLDLPHCCWATCCRAPA